MPSGDRLIGNWTPAVSTTIAAAAVTVTITAGGTKMIDAVRNVHMRVDAADGGSGDVTFSIRMGTTVLRRWVRPFVAGYGATFDYAAECWPAANAAVVIKVARTGLTAATVVYELGTMQPTP